MPLASLWARPAAAKLAGWMEPAVLDGAAHAMRFEDAESQTAIWGRVWGCATDVGELEVVLMNPPTEGGLLADPGRCGAASDLAADAEDDGWYWEGPGECTPRHELPISEMREQWDGLVRVLEDEGVEVLLGADGGCGRFATYTRDPVVAVPGGAVVGRLPARTRQGEERWALRSLAEVGMPVLRTISGGGQLEGGSVIWLDPKTVAVGRSNCVNEEGAEQLETVLRPHGVEVLRVDLGLKEIHLDGLLGMIDVGLALAQVKDLPYAFLKELGSRDIRVLPLADDDDPWIANSLALRPGKVVMPGGLGERTRRAIEEHGTEIVEVPYDRMHLDGGGIRCSTCPLVRKPERPTSRGD